MKPVLNTLVFAAALVAGSHSTWAQPATHREDNAPMGSAMRHGHEGAREAMHAKHHAELKAKLKLTAEQEPRWKEFEDSMKPPARPATPPIDHPALAKMTTPERLDTLKAMHSEHNAARAADMERRDKATRTLYSSLTPSQQKVFDAESMRMPHPQDHRDRTPR